MSYLSLWQRKETPIRRMLFDLLTGDAGETLYERTIINNPASFTTEVAKPLKWLTIPFLPVQSGTGDPSPDNVRPISGWTGVNICRTGKNAFDKQYLSNPASYKNEASGYFYTDAIRLAPNTTYTITPSSTEQLETANYYVLYINPSETDPDYLVITNPDVRYAVQAGTPKVITFTTGATGVIRFGTFTNSLSVFMSIDWQLEIGGTSTAYQPYSGTTIPVSWQTEAWEVYGGELDALTGVLTVKTKSITLTGKTGEYWTAYGSTNLCAVYAPSDKAVGWQKSICNEFNNVNNVFGGEYALGKYCDHPSITNTYFAMPNENVTTLQGFKEWIAEHPIQLVYELATPYTVQLDPVTLSTLIGENVIWTDTNSDNTIVYLSKTEGAGLGGGFGGGLGGGFGGGSDGPDDPGDPDNPDDPQEPDNPEEPTEPEDNDSV